MNQSASASFPPHQYPQGFRARRGLNWGFLGLLYTSFYMCRYNFSIANKAISGEFGFSRAEMGYIITTSLFAYACGQIINGLLTDHIGGKRAMLIGAAGTIVMNILFGAASFAGMLGLFIAIRGVDGYLQAFGAPGMVKINTAWFRHRERGRFSGIFGFMINLGRLGIFTLGPALLAGFTILGLIHIPPLHWRWLFWTPSVICAVAAVGMALTVKETPEEAGFQGVIHDDSGPGDSGVTAPFAQVIRAILSNPAVYILPASSPYVAAGYATGQKVGGADLFHPGLVLRSGLGANWTQQVTGGIELYRNPNQIHHGGLPRAGEQFAGHRALRAGDRLRQRHHDVRRGHFQRLRLPRLAPGLPPRAQAPAHRQEGDAGLV